MNHFFNIKFPEFIEKYGKDWTQFQTILNEYVDFYFKKVWELYQFNNVNTINEKAIDWILKALKIEYTGNDNLKTKKIKLRYFISQYRKKGLAEIYLNLQEAVVGERGSIVSGQSLGVWRWGFSRWHGSTIQASDIRWSLAGSQFEIYINCKTTENSLLDEIVLLYRQSSILPAFYKIYLVDDSYNILRTV
ncbi:hypothetical protein [Leptospira idonii]|uniref:Phage tail protein n=1 Tax=Leptospira idonii TaxID=1193500 RepID=A0A4R9M8G6_9LEPT|nr:hypothetical protein [Leptospira idonii]TGN20818.1 hypothetical protein EHS15_01915 [Leptospira idonii]